VLLLTTRVSEARCARAGGRRGRVHHQAVQSAPPAKRGARPLGAQWQRRVGRDA
jgi:hypothetical protein